MPKLNLYRDPATGRVAQYREGHAPAHLVPVDEKPGRPTRKAQAETETATAAPKRKARKPRNKARTAEETK